MKEKALLAANIGLFILATLLLASAQTSLWLQIFGYFPPPALWIPGLVYLALFRSTMMIVIVSHLLAIALATATAMPEGLMMISCLAVALSVQVFKTRFYWNATTYVMLVCGLATLVFHIYHFIASWILTDHPLTSPAFSAWIIQALLTPLFAPLLFPIFRWFDQVTHRAEPPEVTGAYSA
ncbi:MAG: hypothetical protein RBT63_08595 [Bdellovibrionales bacterium]|jgi:hypothetical protein|nr:hypothetical protein [Bdellovibrionales bacterium]